MLCDRVFTYVDVDCSGTIDHTEMNMAVILLFGEINKYVRVERPSRDDVKRYFDETDIDGNGELDRQEFKQMMMLIGANTIQRVVTVIAITLLSPVIAHKAVDLFKSIAKTRFHAATVVAVFGHEKNLNCIRAETTRAFPFFNEQLVTTIVSVIIVTTAVPFMVSHSRTSSIFINVSTLLYSLLLQFNQYDKMLLGKKEELKKISVNIPGIQDGTTAKASPSTDMTKQENSDGDIPYVRKNQQVHRKLRQRRDSSGWKSRKEKSSEEEEGWATRELRRKPIKVPNPELLMSSK